MSTRFSLQPSSASPPKSSGPRSWPCIQVPNAPSKTRTRSSSASRNGCWAPLPTGRAVPRGSAIAPGYVASSRVAASGIAAPVDCRSAWLPRFESLPPPPIACEADLLAVPVFAERSRSDPAPTSSTPRSAARSPSSWPRPASTPSAARRSRCRRAGSLGAKAAVLVGVGERDTLDADALRRAGAALARRASKVARGRDHVARRRARDSIDRGDAAQAFAEGVALGSYQFLTYKSDAKPSKLDARAGARSGQREGDAPGSSAAPRIAAGRRVGARPRQRARGGEVARRRSRSSRRSSHACNGLEGQGARRRAARARAHGRRARRRARAPSGRRGSCGSTYEPAGARDDGRARRQGRRVRLRRPVAQDRGRHGDDEDRHVGRRPR